MCLSCGCGKFNDEHGDSRNITLADIDQAAEAAHTTREQVVRNIASCLHQEAGRVQEEYQPDLSQGIAPNDPHQTNQNRTTTMHKTASRTPGQYAPQEHEGEDSGTAYGQDLQYPAG